MRRIPREDFLPSTGRLAAFAVPERFAWIRGVRAGDDGRMHYDPMLAKLIAHGQ